MKTKFNNKENQVLTEIYRRLNYFHNGDANTELLLLVLPSTAKIISKYNLITVSGGKETTKVYNWYKLTETGKQFFKPHVNTRLTEKENFYLYTGKNLIQFSKPNTQPQ